MICLSGILSDLSLPAYRCRDFTEYAFSILSKSFDLGTDDVIWGK